MITLTVTKLKNGVSIIRTIDTVTLEGCSTRCMYSNAVSSNVFELYRHRPDATLESYHILRILAPIYKEEI